ncbi:hypothetical protein [Streptomyces sp. NPDC086777]|uniref:hypothetical protein n=1 Tax=Streptomyces sp. NPDC086777 TaxID=3154866 RepID=UPI00345020C9
MLTFGATGTIGVHAVEAARRLGLRPRALVRDLKRAERLLPGVDLVQVKADAPGSVDGVLDPPRLPLDAEPYTIGADPGGRTIAAWAGLVPLRHPATRSDGVPGGGGRAVLVIPLP